MKHYKLVEFASNFKNFKTLHKLKVLYWKFSGNDCECRRDDETISSEGMSLKLVTISANCFLAV